MPLAQGVVSAAFSLSRPKLGVAFPHVYTLAPIDATSRSL
jgi:hypothetical protein